MNLEGRCSFGKFQEKDMNKEHEPHYYTSEDGILVTRNFNCQVAGGLALRTNLHSILVF